MLEYQCWPATYFVTLTYNDLELPEGSTLVPEHTRDWMKRLRYYADKEGVKLRYFLAGEYGERNGRPHYHAMIFADGELRLDYDLAGRVEWSAFHAAWFKDCIVDVKPLIGLEDARKVARYVAGYVVKKFTTDERLEEAYRRGRIKWDPAGRCPEFVRSSRRPGIGCYRVKGWAEALKKWKRAPRTAQPFEEYAEFEPVGAHMLRLDGKKWPLGRYLRGKLLGEFGEDSELSKLVLMDARTRLEQTVKTTAEIAAEEDASEAKARGIATRQRESKSRL